MINAHQGGPETLAEAERFYTFLIKVLAPFHLVYLINSVRCRGEL